MTVEDKDRGFDAVAETLQLADGLETLVIGETKHCPQPNKDQLFEGAVGADPLSLLRHSLTPSKVVEGIRETGEPFSQPFADSRFDLVLCAHLSKDIEISDESLAEIGRVLRPDGLLMILDTVVPGSQLRGKKARRLREAGRYVNTWHRLRNEQHGQFLSWDEWEKRLLDGRWKIEEALEREIAYDFGRWCACLPVSEENRIRLQAMLLQAPEKVKEFLTPSVADARIAFRLTEISILVTKATATTA
jgi:SAM-dependent methyltransferase